MIPEYLYNSLKILYHSHIVFCQFSTFVIQSFRLKFDKLLIFESMRRKFTVFTLNEGTGRHILKRYGTYTLQKSILLSFEGSGLLPVQENIYDCSFNFPLRGVLVNPEQQKDVINVEINLMRETDNLILYSHLSFFQRLYVRYHLNKFWILKPENLKWAIGILIGLIAAIGAWRKRR